MLLYLIDFNLLSTRLDHIGKYKSYLSQLGVIRLASSREQ
jgi:hypothetical protein